MTGVRVSANEAPGACPLCEGEAWLVQKTRARQGKSLTLGHFNAWETVRECANGCHHACGQRVTRGAVSLNRHLMPDCVVSYDVMVRVGLERFLWYRQPEEIRSMLETEHGIRISTGEVSDLSRRFVNYMAWLHQDRSELLKAALESDGGWPLHVDATGEAGRGTLLVAIAGWRKWVLGAWKISTERADLILPCLRQTVQCFGSPCAVMRDMGRAMTPAVNDLVSEQTLTVAVLVSHQHFLADLGKDLLEPAHAQLRSLFRNAKVRAKLRSLVRDLGRQLGEDVKEARQAVLKWQSLTDADLRIEEGLHGLAEVRALARISHRSY